ncbi:tetrahydromethanopterin S-methyltransferase subunit A [Methanobacterium ferruginis]|uniref:tetrahydromethanopterin S-methyltransferase subunit A n=1 Tax=Methanobacterium ferruginis TaxID=710191 RepID=UPI003D9BE297
MLYYDRKKEPAEGWPVINGDYVLGDPQSCVAGATLASHIEEVLVDAGAAISGPCKTENLGIEKMMANLISNPNIRFLILCGSEVQGHITGQSIEALHANGVDPDKRKIVGATGAIPFIENIPDEAIERFQQQLEIVSMIDVEDAAAIQSQVKECIEKDPGAVEEETMIIVVEEDEEVEDGLKGKNHGENFTFIDSEQIMVHLLCLEKNT